VPRASARAGQRRRTAPHSRLASRLARALARRCLSKPKPRVASRRLRNRHAVSVVHVHGPSPWPSGGGVRRHDGMTDGSPIRLRALATAVDGSVADHDRDRRKAARWATSIARRKAIGRRRAHLKRANRRRGARARLTGRGHSWRVQAAWRGGDDGCAANLPAVAGRQASEGSVAACNGATASAASRGATTAAAFEGVTTAPGRRWGDSPVGAHRSWAGPGVVATAVPRTRLPRNPDAPAGAAGEHQPSGDQKRWTVLHGAAFS
jgi:hypothetical protein